MASGNYIKIEFPSLSSNESFARACAAAFAARLDPNFEELSDIKTAVSEAVTNAIVHAYPDSIGMVYMKVSIHKTDVLEISIKDKGRGIADIEKAMEPLFTTGGEDRSGMGFTIMESFMDHVRVKSAAGRGTTVVMSKRIRAKQ